MIKNTKIEKIYLDMDGVLVDNIRGLAECEGVTSSDIMAEKERMYRENPELDYVMVLIRRHIYQNDHFYKCPPLPEFEAFKKLIKHWLTNGIYVEILSSGTSNADIYDEVCRQKVLWLEAHGLGVLPTNFSMGSKQKVDWADPKVLLIDDYVKNVKSFLECGGNALQHRTIRETILALEKMELL